jgi:hypothetical protein
MAQPQMSEFCHRFSWYMCLFIRSQLEVSAPMEPRGGKMHTRHAATRSRSRGCGQAGFGCACASLAPRIIPLASYPEALLSKTESRAKGGGQNRVVEVGGGPRGYKLRLISFSLFVLLLVLGDAIHQAIQHPQTRSCMPSLPHKRHT